MYGLADNEFMLFKSQRSAWSKAQRQECDRKNTEAKTVVKSMENGQGDKICSFVIPHGMAPERLLINADKFCDYAKQQFLFNVRTVHTLKGFHRNFISRILS